MNIIITEPKSSKRNGLKGVLQRVVNVQKMYGKKKSKVLEKRPSNAFVMNDSQTSK